MASNYKFMVLAWKLLTCTQPLVWLAGCVTTETQPDGSTRVRISAVEALGLPKPAPKAPLSAAANASTVPAAPQSRLPLASTTALAKLFTKHPYDGTPKTAFPRVAVTVIDWSGNDCWNATAKIWWSKSKTENVAPFSVCWGTSLGFAVNNAANLHLFIRQTAFEHSGNVRNDGPKPPLMAIPSQQPIRSNQQGAFEGFIEQLILDTGWQAGAPTNMWIVEYANKTQ